MARINSTGSARELLGITSSKELESWLKRVAGPDVFRDTTNWKNVGKKRSNAGPIEASADEINPLVERIVNSIESVIELRVADSGVTPKDPRDAIARLFNVAEGESSRLDERTARELAQFVTVSLKGKRNSTPTIEVNDKGIGIHPSEFADSILDLNESDKGQKTYLVGMYGQGGSSTFDKCEYTVIVSRRHPAHLSDGQSDEVGWTVVRKSLHVRATVYTYFVDHDTGSVPVFCGSISDQIGVDYGTTITHLEYRDTGGFATQAITNNAFYTLNYRLFNPLLPWTLSDRRQTANESRTMRGVPYRINQLPAISGMGATQLQTKDETTVVRHHVRYQHRLPTGSALRVEWWILQDEGAREGRRRRKHHERTYPYKDRTQRYSRRVVAITRGGQTHAALTSTAFSRKKLPQLARSIIVQVDTDAMTYEDSASFFASNRADLKAASQYLVEEALNAAVDLHVDELRAIEREREQEMVAGRGASDEDAIRQHLDPMIRAFQQRTAAHGSSTDQNRRSDSPFRGQQRPTYLRFARNSPLEVRPGTPTRVDLLTDAADAVVRNRRTNLRIGSSADGVRISSPEGGAGRYRVRLFPTTELAVGTQIDLNASLSLPEVWHVDAERPCRLVVVKPPPPFEGNNPPTFIRFRSHNGSIHIRQGGSRISIVTDACNNVIEDGATLTVVSPDPSALPVSGWSGPKDGEFRLALRIAENAPIGDAGQIRAKLNLRDGSALETRADLIIDPRLTPGGQAAMQSRPNYEIKDVMSIPVNQDETSWNDMMHILDIDGPWDGDDVGANVETGDPEQRKVTFYLNADNRELKQVEQRIAKRDSERSVDAFREVHRTLLCFHLYSLAARDESRDLASYSYRDEMIRVSQTLLYTHREFMDAFQAEQTD